MGLAEVWRDLLAGSAGGAAGIVVGQPLDVVKVRQQAEAGMASVPMRDILLRAAREEGPLALFKGMALPLASQGAFTSLSFAGFNATLKWMHHGVAVPDPSVLDVFVAGSVGGALSTLVTTPCELIKVGLQTDHRRTELGGVRRLARQRWREGGVPGLYRGWGITLLRDTPATGLYFLVYQVLKERLHAASDNRLAAELLAGGVAGVISWGSVIPIDVVKTCLQNEAFQPKASRRYAGVADCFAKIWAAEGYKGFTKGSLPLLARAFPVNAVTFVTYERVIGFLNASDDTN